MESDPNQPVPVPFDIGMLRTVSDSRSKEKGRNQTPQAGSDSISGHHQDPPGQNSTPGSFRRKISTLRSRFDGGDIFDNGFIEFISQQNKWHICCTYFYLIKYLISKKADTILRCNEPDQLFIKSQVREFLQMLSAHICILQDISVTT